MEVDKTLPVHYRYEGHAGPNGVIIKLKRFYPIGQTPCFYLVINEWSVNKDMEIFEYSNPKSRKVGKNSLRRFCYPSKEEALKSFKERQIKRVWHANYSLAIAEQSLLGLSKNNDKCPEELPVGMPDFFHGVSWE